MDRIRLLFIILFLSGEVLALPKIGVQLGFGYYQPDLVGFESNNLFPKTSFFSKNALFGYGFTYQFYANTRVGFTHIFSRQPGKIDNAPFVRYLHYRYLMIQSYYQPRKRLELNFTLAPMWNKGSITLDTKTNYAQWDTLLQSYGNPSVSVPHTTKMTTYWLGFASFVGLRFYIFPWLAVDGKAGFMNNFYNAKKWKFQGKQVRGPELKINKLPLFTVRLVVGW